MSSIIDDIKNTNDEFENNFKDNKRYTSLMEFYNKMKSKGLLRPESYSLPPLDTIGKRLYQSQD